MVESFIYFLPLLVLLLGIFVLFSLQKNPAKQHSCFRLSRIFITASYILQIVFYNKPLIFGLTVGNSYTILFISLLYCGGFVVLYLSRKWYAAMNLNGYVFCKNIMLALLWGSLLIASDNLALTIAACLLLSANNYALLKNYVPKNFSLHRGILELLMFCNLLIAIVSVVYIQIKANSLMYEDLHSFLSISAPDFLLYIALMGVIVMFVFLLGLAPLHFWLVEIAGMEILPVATYFFLLPLGAYMGCFIQLNTKVLLPIKDFFSLFYCSIALLSVTVGAIGACSTQNLRKIFAFITVYNEGFILLILHYFTPYAVHSAFIWMMAYMLAIYGLYTTLFGLKIKGEYLSMLEDLAGVAQARPFVAATMLIFMFSVLGFPPLIGFIGTINALNTLAYYRQFYILLYVLLMMVMITYALLPIIKTLWFSESKNRYDRVDGSIYGLLWGDIFLMLLLVIKPQFLAESCFEMLKVVFE